MKREITNLAEKISDLTCELSKACHEKDSFFASSFNVSPTEIKLLRLFEKESRLQIKQIGEKLSITPGRVTHLLTSLENKNLVYRKADENDRRNVWVYLSPKSEPFIKNLNDGNQQLHKTILSYLDKSEQAMVIKALELLLGAINEWKINQ